MHRVIFVQKGEEYLEVEDTTEKIDEEHKFESIAKRCTEEYDIEHYSESESEDDRYLLCRIFDGWMCCVSCVT